MRVCPVCHNRFGRGKDLLIIDDIGFFDVCFNCEQKRNVFEIINKNKGVLEV